MRGGDTIPFTPFSPSVRHAYSPNAEPGKINHAEDDAILINTDFIPIIDKIKDNIRSSNSIRHVPAKIIKVSDIPRTRSGKIAEITVRDIINGMKVKNLEALANPVCLSEYENIEELNN